MISGLVADLIAIALFLLSVCGLLFLLTVLDTTPRESRLPVRATPGGRGSRRRQTSTRRRRWS